MTYCKPANAGLESSKKAVARRLARLLNSMYDEINGYVVEGKIIDDLISLRRKLNDGLEKDGWRVTWDDNKHRWRVLPPKP